MGPMRTSKDGKHRVHVHMAALVLAMSSACAAREVRKLRTELAEARSPSATEGALADELDDESRTRLELIGRTSAPTRYSEKTDENRIRVVAFDFGGADLGQQSDDGGNLWGGYCHRPQPTKVDIRVEPSLGEPAPAAGAPQTIELYKGMFREFSKKIGTGVEVELAVGPAKTTTKVHFSHNFLVLEWRRYQLERLIDNSGCEDEPYVSAIEKGVAIRVVFDVKLRTTDAQLSLSFGIAELAAALARNEATVEVSYEVVGTNLDFLPNEAIVITSLSEYMKVLAELHSAIAKLSDAWEQYNTNASVIEVKDRTGTVRKRDRREVFSPDQLAYYVQGFLVGDTFEHLGNVEVCEDLNQILDYYYAQSVPDASVNGIKENIQGQLAAIETKIDGLTKLDPRAKRRQKRAALRDAQAQQEELRKREAWILGRYEAAERQYFENNCQKTKEKEEARRQWNCERVPANGQTPPYCKKLKSRAAVPEARPEEEQR